MLSFLDSIIDCLNSNGLKYIVIALESTSFYSTYIADFLSSNEELLPFKSFVYCLNLKTVANYRKSFVYMDKMDPLDAYVIADFARCGRITSRPWRGAQFLALQRLTWHRLHLIECITRETAYKVLYEPLNVVIASSFNVIKATQDEVKSIDKAIEKNIRGLNTTEYQSLASIPGIDPVLASGILAEIGTITSFRSNDALAKYAGLTWRVNQSGNYSSDDTKMTKTGNRYLRYYLIEAANSVKKHVPEYKEYYYKKYGEVTCHQHKRALALTARKLVRLIFSLLTRNQIYSSDKVGEIK